MHHADTALFFRQAASLVAAALKDTPVVLVTGPRQCGKTTLVRTLIGDRREFLTMDDDTTLQSTRIDPAGLVRGLNRATIDEVQRVPELLRAIKRSVDEDRQLLTGSANLMTIPTVSESLAGRMEIVELYPLAQAEIYQQRPSFLASAFQGKLVKPGNLVIAENLIDAVLTGGYPEMLNRDRPERRSAWARDYVKAIVQRDVRDIAEIEKLDQLPALIQMLANTSGRLLNFSQMGGQIGLNDKTTRKYTGVLEQLYLVRRVPPWLRSRLDRLVKTPKIHFLDSGLLATLLGATRERVAGDRRIFGSLLETFVLSELLKLCSWAGGGYSIYHYRDKDQAEVDLLIEDPAGQLVGIEVKASATVSTGDFKGLRRLEAMEGKNLKLGLVRYDGDRSASFGGKMYAAPLSCLWG